MSDEIVVLREFANEYEARFAAMALEANGIVAQVFADNAGGAYPSMGIVFPTRLLVRTEDADLAREILDTPAEPPPGFETRVLDAVGALPAAAPRRRRWPRTVSRALAAVVLAVVWQESPTAGGTP